MDYFKLLLPPAIRKITQLYLSLFLIICYVCCGKVCRDIKTLYEAYYQAVVYPERFDNYVQNNQNDFDEDFFSCLDEKRDEIERAIDERQELCDQTYIGGSEFWHQCYDEVDQEYAGLFGVLNAINEVTRYNESFEQTVDGAQLIVLKQLMGISDWENTMISLVPTVEEILMCERCENKFSLF